MDTLQALVVVTVFVCVSSIKEYDFSKHCNEAIKFPDDGEMILHYRMNIQTNCSVDVHNNRTGNSQVVLAHFKAVQITSSQDCRSSRLDIYDGSNIDQNKSLAGSNGICSSYNNLTTLNFNSTQRNMMFKFESNGNSYSMFQILVTIGHTGNCSKNDFDCGNGFCIPSDLVCSGQNNCGNGHDEVACILGLAVWAIVLIVLGCLLVCLCSVVFFLVCRPRRRQYRQI